LRCTLGTLGAAERYGQYAGRLSVLFLCVRCAGTGGGSVAPYPPLAVCPLRPWPFRACPLVAGGLMLDRSCLLSMGLPHGRGSCADGAVAARRVHDPCRSPVANPPTPRVTPAAPADMMCQSRHPAPPPPSKGPASCSGQQWGWHLPHDSSHSGTRLNTPVAPANPRPKRMHTISVQ